MVHAVLTNTDGWFDSMVQLSLVREEARLHFSCDCCNAERPPHFFEDSYLLKYFNVINNIPQGNHNTLIN